MALLKRYLRLELEHAAQEQHPLPRHRPRARSSRPTSSASWTGAVERTAKQHRACSSTSRSTTAAAPRSSTRRGARSRRASPADEIDERRFGEFLYTAGQPDPDLLIRTSGEMRVSNFLLWQIAYAEIWVTDTLWPDFRAPAPARGDPRISEARSPLRRAHRPSRVGANDVTRVLSGVVLASRGLRDRLAGAAWLLLLDCAHCRCVLAFLESPRCAAASGAAPDGRGDRGRGVTCASFDALVASGRACSIRSTWFC